MILSDEAWGKVCKAANRPPDNAEARAELSALLFVEYPAFFYDRDRVADTARRGQRMVANLKAFISDHRIVFDSADITTERDLYYLPRLLRRAEAVCLTARVIQHAHQKRKNVQREWLYHRLCAIWLDHFHAEKLAITVPHGGGEPGGDLIRFMQEAMLQVLPDRPISATLRTAIRRVQKARDHHKKELRKLRAKHGRLTP